MNNEYRELKRINNELSRFWPGWTAVRLLGRGAFGAVYEIRRFVLSSMERAALKVLSVPADESELYQLRFQGMSKESIEDYYENYVNSIQNEIVIMQKLVGNSHLVSYEDYMIRKRYDIGWDIYIRMELLIGITDYLSKNILDDQLIIKLGMDVSLGLSYCHKNGIIHRDVKPQNIFIGRGGNFKLGDFGVSRVEPKSHDALSFKGTIPYMAPEVFKMESTDARSDIYSIGMVLYECLNNNRQPFVPENFTPTDLEYSRQKRFAGERLPNPAHGSGKLKRIVLKALAFDPDKRYQSAEELHKALSSLYKPQKGVDYAAEFWANRKPDDSKPDEDYQKYKQMPGYEDRKAQRNTGATETVVLDQEQEKSEAKSQSNKSKEQESQPIQYSVSITPKEALSGCTKMITHHGRQIAVVINAGYKEGSIEVSFEGEKILINPVIKETKRYTVTLTPEEAYYGCMKMVKHHGRQVAVIIEPGLRETTTQVSFEGETIIVDTIIKYWE